MPAARVGPSSDPYDDQWIVKAETTPSCTQPRTCAVHPRDRICVAPTPRSTSSMAMNGLAAYNPKAVAKVITQVTKYLELEDIYNAKQEETPANASQCPADHQGRRHRVQRAAEEGRRLHGDRPAADARAHGTPGHGHLPDLDSAATTSARLPAALVLTPCTGSRRAAPRISTGADP